MSKRTQSIRSMFAVKPEDSAPTGEALRPSRVTSGAVRSLKDTFSGVEKDYQELREKLAEGTVAIEVEPFLIDPSPFADRFESDDFQSFEALKQSIAERGQEIPILIRENPAQVGRYQSAYGHRRVRALRDLGRPVRAYVKILTDEELALAQGIENSAREDLSFIERAIFATRLEDGGFKRSVLQTALTVDRAEASKLIAVGRGVPSDIVAAIGRAPRVGRGRWQMFVDCLQDADALQRVRITLQSSQTKAKDSNDRFALALAAASKGPKISQTSTKPIVARTASGHEIAKLTHSAKHSRIQITSEANREFSEFLMHKLPDLFAAYTEEESQND